eukprot:scaffold115330_cov36-Prasinocladus_malaysianus.AAC.1
MTIGVKGLQLDPPEPSPGHLRLVPPVDPGDVVALDVAHVVQGRVPGKGHREVVAEGEDLAALVRQVVDQLAVLAVLT